jgi:hypothetical protein
MRTILEFAGGINSNAALTSDIAFASDSPADHAAWLVVSTNVMVTKMNAITIAIVIV